MAPGRPARIGGARGRGGDQERQCRPLRHGGDDEENSREEELEQERHEGMPGVQAAGARGDRRERAEHRQERQRGGTAQPGAGGGAP